MTIRRRSRLPNGFTIIEMIVALAVAGLSVTTGRLLVETIGRGASDLLNSTASLGGAANAEDLVRTTVSRLSAAGRDEPFVGTAKVARFATHCLVAGGWLEQCSATIRVDSSASGVSVIMTSPALDRVILRNQLRYAALMFLESSERGGVWRTEWSGTRTAPLAIGVDVGLDTMILRIGSRG